VDCQQVLGDLSTENGKLCECYSKHLHPAPDASNVIENPLKTELQPLPDHNALFTVGRNGDQILINE
jgi:hypothetical protein